MATKKNSKPAPKGSKKGKKLNSKKELNKARTLTRLSTLRAGPTNF